LEIGKKLSQTGVFLRADAPRLLRNPEDPFLPIHLEIINGVEKAAHTTGAAFSSYFPREPLKLTGVDVFLKPSGARRQFASDPLLLGDSREFTFDARTGGEPALIRDRLAKTLEVPRETWEGYLSRHFIGGPFSLLDLKVSFHVLGWTSQDFYLRVRPNAPPLPRLPNWYRGDLHYHSGFTNNPAERGYPLQVTKQAALQAGLDWLLLADHSTDLNAELYSQELREVRQQRDGRFVYIPGEELTLASGKEGLLSTVHMIAMPSADDPDKGFPEVSRP